MSALYLPSECPPSVPLFWGTAEGYIYSWVRTDHPGYRRVFFAGTPYQIPAGTYRWDDFIVAADAAWSSAMSVALAPDGRVQMASNAPTVPTMWDRVGWLFGLGLEAGVYAYDGDFTSHFVPPGGIPLEGIDWSSIELVRESELQIDASHRPGGYTYGAARLYRCPVVMTRWAWEALRTGWCFKTKITLISTRGSSSPLTGANPTGTITGKLLGLEGEPTWRDPTTQMFVNAVLVIASEP